MNEWAAADEATAFYVLVISRISAHERLEPAGTCRCLGVIEANSGKGRRPVSQQVNEPAICKTRRSGAFGHVADARAAEHSFQHQLGALQRHRPLNIKAHFLAMAFEFPAIDRSARQAQADAVMRQQVLRRLRSPASLDIGRGGRDDRALFGFQHHRDHILRHGISEREYQRRSHPLRHQSFCLR